MCSLGAANVFRSWALRTLLDFEGNFFTFCEFVKQSVYYILSVEEYILTTVVRLDKAEALISLTYN